MIKIRRKKTYNTPTMPTNPQMEQDFLQFFSGTKPNFETLGPCYPFSIMPFSVPSSSKIQPRKPNVSTESGNAAPLVPSNAACSKIGSNHLWYLETKVNHVVGMDEWVVKHRPVMNRHGIRWGYNTCDMQLSIGSMGRLDVYLQLLEFYGKYEYG